MHKPMHAETNQCRNITPQDEATSVVFGMPRAAIELNAAEQVVPLPRMADAIVKAVAAQAR